MKQQLQRMGMMCLMMLATLWASAATTATWSFKTDTPKGICESTNYEGVEADIESDVTGIFMHVDATKGKLNCVGRNNAQFNAGTILQVPVSSNQDVVTVEGYQGYSKYHFATDETVYENTATHTATNAEVKQGYVEIISDGGYLNEISVVLNKSLKPIADITGTWDYSNSKVMEETMALSGSNTEGKVKAIEDNGLVMTVIANGATFRNNANSNIQVRKGAVFRVPVQSTEDVVTIKGYPGYSYYLIGSSTEEIKNTTDNPVTTYTAKNSDVAQGYVAITSNNDNNYFYSISVVQKPQAEKEVLENKDATVTFPFNLGTEGQKADFGEAGDYFLNSKVIVGSGLWIKDKNTIGGIDETRIEPYDQNNTPDKTNIIQFIIQPKFGLTFTPTEVAFKTTRFGTDNGLLDIAWLNADGSTISLATEVKPIRNNTDPKVDDLNYKVEGAAPSDGACGLQINLYHLQSGKQIGFADIVIKGLLNGQEVEVPMLNTFTANGVEYLADNVFEADGDQYVATIELSKEDAMISASNPLTNITTLSGEVGEITYQGDDTQCTATIPVSLASVTINYVVNFVQKPDFTLTYFDTDGATMGTQTVEKDAAIGAFDIDFTTAKAEEGYKVRGWFVKKSGGQKYTVNDIVTSDLSLYAVATEIEGPSTYKKYQFNLNESTFYPEDHEAFNSIGSGYWHDGQHGWAFKNGDKIELLVGEKAVISVGNCLYSASDAELVFKTEDGTEVGRIPGKGETDGEIATYAYEGAAGKLIMEIASSGAVYIHSVRIVNTSETNYDNQGNWYFVKAGNASSFIDVLDAVNGANGSRDAARSYIFLPNGTYDLGETVLTAISGHNISIIGQSMEGTIIRNAPDVSIEGIGTTATLISSGQNLYMQDLTLKNDLDYYSAGSAGRAVCFQDKADRAIFKNVAMLSYQDTYYSQGTKQSYWETCDVHGTVDFLCGGGDVRFQNTTISLEPRNLNGTGGRTICAPTTTGDFGYVFDGCKVVDLAEGKGDWNFGRTWQNTPIAIYLNTTLDANAEKTLVSSRWTQKGMNNKDPKVFGEYNTMNESGANITPASNTITSFGGQFETILSAEQAEAYSYDKMFKENANAWDPASMTIQKAAPEATYANGEVSWKAVEGAIAYAIFVNDEFVGLADADATSYALTAADGDVITIRSANAMGGFGEAATVEAKTVAIAISDYDQGTLPAGEYASIACDRTILKGLNTVVLPFDATPEEIGASKVLEYTGTRMDAGNIILQFRTVKALSANTPYAIFADADYPIESFENKTVVEPTNLTVNDPEYSFVGTYNAYEKGESPIVNGDLIADVDEFTLANGGNKIRAYRAYLKKVGTSEANITFDFDGNFVNGIEAARLLNDMSGDTIYNLNGQKVTRTQKGVYIINGKKVLR